MGDGGLSIIGRGDQENVEKEGNPLDRIYRMGRIGGRGPPVPLVPVVPFCLPSPLPPARGTVCRSPVGG